MTGPDSQIDRAFHYAIAEMTRLGGMQNLPIPLRTLILVHNAQGIIDNGGLQYFFESDFVEKPPYSLFVNAYRLIGATEAADALASAVQLFPFSNPHKFRGRRNKFLDTFLDDARPRPDSPFEPLSDRLCGNEDIWRLLALFVANHAVEFRL